MNSLRFVAIAVLFVGCTDTSDDAPPTSSQANSSNAQRKTRTVQEDTNAQPGRKLFAKHDHLVVRESASDSASTLVAVDTGHELVEMSRQDGWVEVGVARRIFDGGDQFKRLLLACEILPRRVGRHGHRAVGRREPVLTLDGGEGIGAGEQAADGVSAVSICGGAAAKPDRDLDVGQGIAAAITHVMAATDGDSNSLAMCIARVVCMVLLLGRRGPAGDTRPTRKAYHESTGPVRPFGGIVVAPRREV